VSPGRAPLTSRTGPCSSSLRPREPTRCFGAPSSAPAAPRIADPRILSWWTETDLTTDSLHQSDAPLGLTWCSWLLTCAHPAWKSISPPHFFCTSGKETVENLKISRGQLAPCQKNRIKRQQTVRSAGCKVLVTNAGFLLASMPSYCRFRPIKCCYSQSVSVSVHQDKIRGSAILSHHWSRNAAGSSEHLGHLQVVAKCGGPVVHRHGPRNVEGKRDGLQGAPSRSMSRDILLSAQEHPLHRLRRRLQRGEWVPPIQSRLETQRYAPGCAQCHTWQSRAVHILRQKKQPLTARHSRDEAAGTSVSCGTQGE